MARIARLVAPGAPHHVTQRRNWPLETSLEDRDYVHYRKLMAQGCRRCFVHIPPVTKNQRWTFTKNESPTTNHRESEPQSPQRPPKSVPLCALCDLCGSNRSLSPRWRTMIVRLAISASRVPFHPTHPFGFQIPQTANNEPPTTNNAPSPFPSSSSCPFCLIVHSILIFGYQTPLIRKESRPSNRSSLRSVNGLPLVLCRLLRAAGQRHVLISRDFPRSTQCSGAAFAPGRYSRRSRKHGSGKIDLPQRHGEKPRSRDRRR